MRVFVFGSRGQLGRELMSLFEESGDDTAGGDLPELDIAEPRQVEAALSAFRPDVVLNAAAYTDVEGAEDDAPGAFRGNETGARVVAQAAAAIGAPVVFYSTDYVFRGDGTRPYEPGDPLEPLSVYGKSKAAGETAVREANPRHFIVRTAWLYGPGGNHFVEKILRAASARPELRVVEDEVGSPTHTRDLAKATRALVATDACGEYHAVNAGACSRFEYARAILELAGVDIPVHPCTGDEFPTKAPRPVYSVLSNAKLEQATGHVMPHWRDGLAAYMARR